ncbi:hypothetical protein JTE90_022067 [Oedothorax gibbosus]|uniref:Uncharacterized protein n=1 Tax=Oedothorax gibbosus TaxID=931172 RepID=A0AAV6TWC6_9ARAC|nr:hypothetical protein JTE90_022067 [Oedothorax gibbosus]
MIVSSDEEDFVPLRKKAKTPGDASRKNKRSVKVDLNLSASELPGGSKQTLPPPPYSIYLGSDIVVEIKPFKKEHYLGFSKNVDGEIKNRFNINVKQIHTVKRAIDAMIESNNFEVLKKNSRCSPKFICCTLVHLFKNVSI